VVGLAGTPHLWIADDQGVLHWGGDTRALHDRPIHWNDWLQLTEAEIRAAPRGDPWLTAGLLKDGDPIYLVKWETEATVPYLLRIQCIPDVELFGIDESNYGLFVIEKSQWEQRFGLAAAGLVHAELSSATSCRAGTPPGGMGAPGSGGGGAGSGGDSGGSAAAGDGSGGSTGGTVNTGGDPGTTPEPPALPVSPPAPPAPPAVPIDLTVPHGALDHSGVDDRGRQYVQVSFFDTASGLASIQSVAACQRNAEVSIPGFARGTKDTIYVRVTRSSNSGDSTARLEVIDVAGNKGDLDVIVTGNRDYSGGAC
jgi:hypothetical protein